NLDVSPADLPAARDVLLVVGSGEQLLEPAEQRGLQPGDLLAAAGNYLQGLRLPLDRRIEVVDQHPKGGLDNGPGPPDQIPVFAGTADIALQALIALKHLAILLAACHGEPWKRTANEYCSRSDGNANDVPRLVRWSVASGEW